MSRSGGGDGRGCVCGVSCAATRRAGGGPSSSRAKGSRGATAGGPSSCGQRSPQSGWRGPGGPGARLPGVRRIRPRRGRRGRRPHHPARLRRDGRLDARRDPAPAGTGGGMTPRPPPHQHQHRPPRAAPRIRTRPRRSVEGRGELSGTVARPEISHGTRRQRVPRSRLASGGSARRTSGSLQPLVHGHPCPWRRFRRWWLLR